MSDAARYVDRIVVPYAPSRIVLYEGDNDIAAGKSPQQILDDLKSFVAHDYDSQVRHDDSSRIRFLVRVSATK